MSGLNLKISYGSGTPIVQVRLYDIDAHAFVDNNGGTGTMEEKIP